MVSQREVKDTGIIDEPQIFELLEEARTASKEQALEIVEKAKSFSGLSLEELAILLQSNAPEVREAIFETARAVKERVYGTRMVFFAPLYVSNACVNNCLYCGFRKDNKELKRRVLSMEEIEKEIKILLDQGHKRILLVAGEHPKLNNIDYVVQAVNTIYQTSSGNASIRRVNVNCAPLSIEEYRRLKESNIGTYQLFQETYHNETYRQMHPSGPKALYGWRIEAPSRAMEAGIDDVGIGPLFGLFDWKFEVMATLMHAQYLDGKYGVGPHTISVPRLEPALNAPVAMNPPFQITDDDMKMIVATLRLAVPYTGIILSTRERPEFRDQLFALGVSQTSAGSRTSPGGYSDAEAHKPDAEQFSIGDTRDLAELTCQMCREGYIPSFCTACYRSHRTGGNFMKLAKHGEIHKMCEPNALLSFKEYLIDYADAQTRVEGEKILAERLAKLSPNMRKKTEALLAEIETGKRDVYI